MASASPRPNEPNTIITRRLIRLDGTHILSNQINSANTIIPYLQTILRVLLDVLVLSDTKSSTIFPRYSPKPIIPPPNTILPIPWITCVMSFPTSDNPNNSNICELPIRSTRVKIIHLTTLVICVDLILIPVIPTLVNKEGKSIPVKNLLAISAMTFAMI